MLTKEIVDYLIELKKWIIEDENVLENRVYTPGFPVNERIYMISKDDSVYNFFVEIWQSKNYLKLTLHLQENETSTGLLRVDFNGRHKNPEELNEFVPELFKQYAGMWLEESHIHYFIEGYDPLVWAIPLYKDESFGVKNFSSSNDYLDVFKEFMNRINLETKIIINLQTKLV